VARKSDREKLADDRDLPRIERLNGEQRRRFGGAATMVLAPASEIDALMRRVPKGRLTTVNHIREALARRHRADIACPIVTGIHARIAAGAAGEAEAEGRTRVTPYWRTLKVGGEVNPKYPGGLAGQKRRLEAEGHRVLVRRARAFVEDYERALAPLR